MMAEVSRGYLAAQLSVIATTARLAETEIRQRWTCRADLDRYLEQITEATKKARRLAERFRA